MHGRAATEMAHFLDLLQASRRAVAIAKLTEFANQAEDLSARLPEQWHGRAQDALLEVALANGLDRTHGTDLIQAILAASFNDGGR
ncbi:hypothetical protein [Bradyrhizobium neotropicale]|uniref:hypothetical protein n=1 Tax=Bradyrhizobium neotropicale TaxID=1497615 RepID=UPI001AD7E0DA|nr:hypothetical protein [Bradyrhizobium neotropicale]MBO4221993.1 hypothetical protein [Bradyrhizobium neotropicale]